MKEGAVINELPMADPIVEDATALTWHDANRRYLAEALSSVYAYLEAVLRPDAVIEFSAALQPDATAPWPFDALPALEQVCSSLELSNFERGVLLMAAGVELDSRFSDMYGSMNGSRHSLPTLGLALTSLPEAHWSALTPARPLRSLQLIHVLSADTLIGSAFKIDESILHYLTGLSADDAPLNHVLQCVPHPRRLPFSYRELAECVAGIWARRDEDPCAVGARTPLIELCGESVDANGAIASAAAALLDLRLYSLKLRTLAQLTAAEASLLIRLCEREALLNRAALLLDVPHEPTDALQAIIGLVREAVRVPVALSVRRPVLADSLPRVRFSVGRPKRSEQAILWAEAVESVAQETCKSAIDAITAQFSFYPAGIDSAAQMALATPAAGESELNLERALWDACRMETRPQLDWLAERIEPAASWDDLVLPAKDREHLQRVAIHVRQRTRVYERWGFELKGSRGLGISALFAGPSGTGKTMAAEVLARELHLDLFRIDLSQVVSKYIGETEKNLSRVFDAADQGATILLFDEADALFGRRSEVKDSHDRYANVEVSYLLQRMEAYRGLAILTTNRKSALDPAFLRRIRFVVDFQFPEAAQRVEIWRRVFPSQTPIEQIDIEKLGRLRISGAHIHNIALSAAFLAADAEQPVRMEHIVNAAREELAKLEMPLAETEIAGWL